MTAYLVILACETEWMALELHFYYLVHNYKVIFDSAISII